MIFGRRRFLQAGAGLALAPYLGGCTEADFNEATMITGYEMPLESAPHERTFMQWPVSVDVYGRALLGRVQASIALIANTISKYEPVVMLVGDRNAPPATGLLHGGVDR